MAGPTRVLSAPFSDDALLSTRRREPFLRSTYSPTARSTSGTLSNLAALSS